MFSLFMSMTCAAAAENYSAVIGDYGSECLQMCKEDSSRCLEAIEAMTKELEVKSSKFQKLRDSDNLKLQDDINELSRP